MSKGVGVDIVSISRVAEALERTEGFAERILTESELTQMNSVKQQVSFVAKRFAAKEAVVKALGTGVGRGIGWGQIEVSNDELGAPKVSLSGAALERLQTLGASNCLLSLSDERESAIAFVVLV